MGFEEPEQPGLGEVVGEEGFAWRSRAVSVGPETPTAAVARAQRHAAGMTTPRGMAAAVPPGAPAPVSTAASLG